MAAELNCAKNMQGTSDKYWQENDVLKWILIQIYNQEKIECSITFFGLREQNSK